jgi:hypothetical protein
MVAVKKLRKTLMVAAVGMCIGATAMAFSAPSAGSAHFSGFCNGNGPAAQAAGHERANYNKGC